MSRSKPTTGPSSQEGLTDENLQELLSEEEIRQAMSDISREYPKQRQSLKDAYKVLGKTNAKAQLAVTFFQPHVLENPDAKKYLATAIADGVKLLADDKKAIVLLETEDAQWAYDDAKLDCETSDKHFAKLESQLIHYQALMKFTGHRIVSGEQISSGRVE